MSRKRRARLISHFLLIISLGILIYIPAFPASFHFDDGPSLLENFYLRDLHHVRELWLFWPTRFFLYLTLALDFRFCGLNVFGYHVTNVAIHLLNGLLVYVAGRFFFAAGLFPVTRRSPRKINQAALIASLIFLCHPLQTEAVTYVVQRATSLASFFYLLSLVFYLKSGARAVERGEKGKNEAGGFKCAAFYLLSLISFLPALFCKEMVVSLPLVLILVELGVFPSGGRRRFYRVVPFALLALLVPSLVLIYSANPHYNDSGQIDFMRRSRTADLLAPGWNEYFFTQFRVLVSYFRLLFLPVRQNLDHHRPVFFTFWQGQVVLSASFLAALVACGVKALRGGKMVVGFSIFYFFLVLLPESSFIPIKDVIYEHRSYLAVLSVALFSGWYAYRAVPAPGRRLVIPIMVACLGLLTFHRNLIWKDDLSLWQDTAAKSPAKARPHHNLGLAWAERGEWRKARDEYLLSLEHEPRFYKSHANLGVACRELGLYPEAVARFEEAIRLCPAYLPSYNNLALLHLDQGRLRPAGELLRRALEIERDDPRTLFNYALYFKESGDLKEAESLYRKVLQLRPDRWEARLNLATVLLGRGDMTGAEAELRRAIALNPRSAASHYNLGNIQALREAYSEAVRSYESAVALKKDYSDAYNNLGNAYKVLGRYRRSVESYLKALEAEPDHGEALENLRLILLQRSEDSGMAAAIRRWLEKRPDSPLKEKVRAVVPGGTP